MEGTPGGEEGISNADGQNPKSRIRPAETDEENGTPAKMMKLAADLNVDESNDVEGNDSDVDLGDEEDFEIHEEPPEQGDIEEDYEIHEEPPEQVDIEEDEGQLDLEEPDYTGESDPPGPEFEEDFEEGDTYDEDEGEVGAAVEDGDDTIQEEADSSTDVQEYVQTNLANIEDCQSAIDNLNHKANEEILLVELKYNKLRLPVYKRRNKYIEGVPRFWATVFSRHRQLRQVLTKEDIKCLNHVAKLQVEDFEDNRAGYIIQFYFNENPWFENRVITKEYHLPWNGSASCTCTPIKWKKGMNLTYKSSSFFSWFTSQEDASADDIAEIIKDDLWPNPLQCFLLTNKQPEESDEEEEADDSGNLTSKDDSIVLLDDTNDDDVEYISSDDDEEQSWQGGKGGATSAQYTVQDDDGDDYDEYEEFDEDDAEVTGSSGPPVAQGNNGRKDQSEVINIEDDYLGSEDEDDEPDYLEGDGTPDLDDKLLQGQVGNDGLEDSKGTEESHDRSTEEVHTPGEVEILQADSSHETNEDSRQSNGIVVSSTNLDDDPPETDPPDEMAKCKLQEQSKVVSTTADSDTVDGAT